MDLLDVYGIMATKLLPTVTNFAPTIATIISNVCTQVGIIIINNNNINESRFKEQFIF